jgi:hypothetical protein
MPEATLICLDRVNYRQKSRLTSRLTQRVDIYHPLANQWKNGGIDINARSRGRPSALRERDEEGGVLDFRYAAAPRSLGERPELGWLDVPRGRGAQGREPLPPAATARHRGTLPRGVGCRDLGALLRRMEGWLGVARGPAGHRVATADPGGADVPQPPTARFRPPTPTTNTVLGQYPEAQVFWPKAGCFYGRSTGLLAKSRVLREQKHRTSGPEVPGC